MQLCLGRRRFLVGSIIVIIIFNLANIIRSLYRCDYRYDIVISKCLILLAIAEFINGCVQFIEEVSKFRKRQEITIRRRSIFSLKLNKKRNKSKMHVTALETAGNVGAITRQNFTPCLLFNEAIKRCASSWKGNPFAMPIAPKTHGTSHISKYYRLLLWSAINSRHNHRRMIMKLQPVRKIYATAVSSSVVRLHK